MPKEYVESINYEYNKVDGQTYINVNVVRPIEKIKVETVSHHSSKLSRAKSSLKSSTGKTQTNQPQEQDILAQQQAQQLQQQQFLEQQQQQQLEQQQQAQEEQEYQEQEEEAEVNEEEEQYEENDEVQEEVEDEENDRVLPNGRTLNEQLLRIEMRKLELKELELRRSEIRDLEQRRNDLLRSITILRRRRGNSSEPVRTWTSTLSRPSSVESVYRSKVSQPREKVSTAKNSNTRPQAPSNYQNGSSANQGVTRTIAPPETRNRTVREVANTDYELESQTEYEKRLNLPTKSQWANTVQNRTNQVWLNGGGFQVSPGPFPGQQMYQNYSQNNQQFAAQPSMHQISNQMPQQQSFGQQFAQNQQFNQNLGQLTQTNFPNQQPQAPQMDSSINFQTPQQNYFQ